MEGNRELTREEIVTTKGFLMSERYTGPSPSTAEFLDVSTDDNLQYTFYPVSNGVINFRVRATNDAHIALTSGPNESDPMVEVFIGGWGNSKSVIRRNRQKPDKVEVVTQDILNGGEFRGFWVRWSGGSVSAGREGEADPFIAWDDPEPFFIGHFGVATGWGASGTWLIEVPAASAPPPPQAAAYTAGGAFDPSCWVDAQGGDIPSGAIVGGHDGDEIFVARASHEGALIPGKLMRSHGCCYVAWGGGEFAKPEYQVLCGCAVRWVPTSGAAVPANALPGGESEDGEPLFIGRVAHENSLTVGKVQSSHGVCYISYGGEELGFNDYEVLCPE